MLTVLSDQEQELLTGGADFELAASNYGNKGSILMEQVLPVLKVALLAPLVRLILY